MLKTSARREFEEARHEHDPLIIARMLVVGRQCVVKTQHKFDAASRSHSKTRRPPRSSAGTASGMRTARSCCRSCALRRTSRARASTRSSAGRGGGADARSHGAQGLTSYVKHLRLALAWLSTPTVYTYGTPYV